MTDQNTLDKLFLSIYYRGKDKKGYSDFELKQDIKKVESLIADREKKMLEFVKLEKKPVRKDPKTLQSKLKGQPYPIDQFNSGYNKALDDMSQRAKEWSKRNDKS